MISGVKNTSIDWSLESHVSLAFIKILVKMKLGPTFFLDPNKLWPQKILGPKSLLKIGPVIAEILQIWTSVTRTNVVWTGVTVSLSNCVMRSPLLCV